MKIPVRRQKNWFEGLAILTIIVSCFSWINIGICKAIDGIMVKHILVLLTILCGMIKMNMKMSGRRYFKETKIISYMTLGIIAITVFFMIINGFSKDWILQAYFFIAPAWFVFVVLADNESKETFDIYMNTIFYTLTVAFIIKAVPILDIQHIKSISFADSYSPFEFGAAQNFVVLYIYYSYRAKRKKQIACFIMSIMSWKRMGVVFTLIFTIWHLIFKENKKRKMFFLIVTVVVFVLVPNIMKLIVNEEFAAWFYSKFHITLQKFMMTRYEMIDYVTEHLIPNKGLGTYFMVKIPWYGGWLEQSLHNDILRLDLELTTFGLAFVLCSYAFLAKTNYSFFVIVYIFTELSSSHFFGNGSSIYWITILTSIYYMDTYPKELSKKSINSKREIV